MKNISTFLWVLLVLVFSAASSYDSSSHHSDEDQTTSEEDLGSGDEDLSDVFSDVRRDVIVRCYKCTGVSHESGCNVTLLLQNPESHLTDCNGHCVNLTTGHNTIFDCTEIVTTRTARCFQRNEVEMCVCGTDFCNGPPSNPKDDVMELPTSQNGIQLLSDYEVDVILPGSMKQGRNNNGSDTQNAENSGNHNARLCGSVFFLLNLWWGVAVLKDLTL